MPESQHRSRWLAMILAVYIGLAVAASVIVPLGEAPDELDHFLYLRYLVVEREFPPLSPVAAENPTMEANQPPLYYALGALAGSWIDMRQPFEPAQNTCFSFDPADPGRQTFYVHTLGEAWPYRGTVLAYHVARLFSIALGALAVLLAYRLGRQLVPGDGRAALLAAALLAFNPQFIFITASVNNDVLAAVLGAALVSTAVAAWHAPTRMRFLLLGLLAGLGALAKAGLLALWPVALLAAAAPLVHTLFVRGKRPWRQALRDSAGPLFITGGLPLLIAGWWYGRATLLYGDPLAWRVHLAAKGPFVLREGELGADDIVGFIDLHFRSSVGLFGWLNVAAPTWTYLFYGVVLLGSSAGLVWALAACLRRQEGCYLDLPAAAFAGLAVLGTYASLLRYIQTINWSGYQGRLAFAAVGPLAALAAAGLAYLLRRASASSNLTPAAGAAAGLVVTMPALVMVLFVLPAAYPRPGIYQLPDLAQLCARFEPGLLVDGVAAPERAETGETVPVTISSFGLAGQSGAGTLHVELLATDGTVVTKSAAPVTWEAGETLTTTVNVPVPAVLPPGRSTLAARLDGADGSWASAQSANGRELAMPVTLQTMKIPAPPAGDPEMELATVFDGRMRLDGFDLATGDESMTVELVWSALAPLPEDYTTFVHLLDGNGRLLAQADGQPQGGAYPTGIWDIAESVADPKLLALPAELPDGPLRLVSGVYGADGVRLPVPGSADNTALLAEFADALALRSGAPQP